MNNNLFEFENSTKILSGKRCLENIPFELKSLGVSAPLLISDDLIEKLGLLKNVIKAFNSGDISVKRIFSKVPDVATIEVVEYLLKIYKEENCDSIIAVGRSSVISVAKAIKYLISLGIDSFADIKCSNHIVNSIPLFIVPVFLGTGTEATHASNVFDIKTNKTYEIVSSNLKPNAIFIDDRMTDKIPLKLFINTCFYIIANSISSLESNNSNPVNDVYAYTALQLIVDELKNIKNINKGNYNTKITESMIYSGIAKSNTEITILDVIANNISRIKKIPREILYGFLFINNFNKIKNDENSRNKDLSISIDNYQNLFNVLGVDGTVNDFYTLIDEIFINFAKLAEVDINLRSLGVERIEFSKFAELILFDADVKKLKDYRFQDIVDILEKAY